MAAANYSPPAEALIKATRADFDRRDVVQPVHLVQYDDTLPVLAVALYKGGQPWTLPTGADVNLRMDKKDGHYVYNPALGVSSDRSTVYMAVTAQMTTGYGTFAPVVEVLAGGGVAGMAALRLDIDRNPVQDGMLESTDEYKAVQALAAEVAANAKIVRDNEAGIQDVHENIEAIKAAPANAKAAADSAKEARSWAVGDTASRPGEGMNNAKYYAEQAQQVSQGAVGWYETEQALQVAHPTGQNGQWAIIGTTDTIWTWDSDTSAWVNTGSQIDLSNYYQKQEADARFQMPIGYVFEWASVPEQSVDLSTPEKVAQYFGYGTWAAFGAGQFLLGAGGSYQAGNTGGEAEHTLTQGELPNVSVGVEVVFGGPSGSSVYSATNAGMVGLPYNSADAGKTKPLGSGQAHNNMPPYIVVYRWQRIA